MNFSSTNNKIGINNSFDTLLALISTFAAGLVFFLLFRNIPAAIWFVASGSWLIVSVSSARSLEGRWSPTRTFVPVWVGYSMVSISLSGTSTSQVEIVALILAASGFVFGYLIANQTHQSSQIIEDRPAPKMRTALLVSLFAFASIVLISLAIRAGELPALSSNPNRARLDFFPNGYLSTIVVVGFQVTIIGAISAVALKIEGAHKPRLLLLAIVSMLALASLGNRGMLVAPLLISALVWLWTRKFSLSLALMVGLFSLFAISAVGYDRNVTAFGNSYVEDLSRSGYSESARLFAPVASYVAGTSETFSRTMMLVPSKVPFQYGTQFFGPLLFQESTDLYLKKQLGLNFEGFGLAIGFQNALYLDWGLIGDFLGSVVIGVIVGLFFRRASSKQPIWIILNSYVLARLILSLYGHPFAYLYYLVEPLLLLAIFFPSNKKNRIRKLVSQGAGGVRSREYG